MRDFLNRYRSNALFGLGFGVFLYSLMMSQQLTNTFDGLWHQNYYHSGVPELTSGRWMLYFVDKLTMGLHADPIASVMSLILFVLGFLLVLELLGVKGKAAGYLGMALWISSTVISNTLSYRMTSIGYGIAYLLAVVGVFAAVKIENKIAAVLIAGITLGLSMACYQANLGVFCIVAVFYLILQCNVTDKSEKKDNIIFLYKVIRIVCTLIVGAIFYIASLYIFLKLKNISLSDYNGGSSITLPSLIMNLPGNILKTYKYFGVYFFSNALKLNRLQYFGGFYLLLALLVGLVVWIGIKAWKNSKVRLVALIAFSLMIPIACNAYMLIAGDKLELQMTAGLAMLMPLAFIIAFSCVGKKVWVKMLCALFCVAMLYGNSMQVWFDQEAMYEGRNSSENIAAQVISDLQDKDLLSDKYEYYFIGVPARNEYFSVSEIYACANGYAQLGNFWTSGRCPQLSYHGLINKHMGFDLPMSYLYYDEVAENYDISGIETFPREGYIAVYDNRLVVIKISELEKYSDYSLYMN